MTKNIWKILKYSVKYNRACAHNKQKVTKYDFDLLGVSS